MPRIQVVFDNPLKEKESWVEKLCAQSKLVLVDNDKVSHHMSFEDPEAKKALLKEMSDPVGGAERLAPHYHRALEALYGKEQRLGLYGTAWLVYTKPIDACIVDWSEVESRVKNLSPAEREAAKVVAAAPKGAAVTNTLAESRQEFDSTAHQFVRNRIKKYVPPGKALELPSGLTDYEKGIQASAFLRKLGLIT